MKKLKQIKVMSFAKFQAVLMSLLGLIAGIVYSFGGAIYDIFSTGINWGTALAFFALIGMPIIFAAFGFIIGIVEAILYNMFGKWFGGVEITLEA